MELIESWESQGFTVPSSGAISATKEYYVTGSSSGTDVFHFLGDNVPRLFGGLPLTNIEVVPLGPLLFSAVCSYGIESGANNRTNISPPPITTNSGADSYVFSFSTTGGTYRRKHAVENNQNFGPAPTNLLDFINWNGQECEGIDVVIPQLQFNIRKRRSGSSITLPYINTMVSLTGKTNNATFMGFAQGELLFLGAEGQQVKDGDTEITYTFSAQPNVASLTVGGITVTDKKGHEYIWSFITPVASSTSTPLVRTVYKSKIYEEGNFSLLGI